MKKKLYSYIYCNVKIKGQCTQNMYKKKNHCCAIGLFSYLMKNNPSIVSVNYL